MTFSICDMQGPTSREAKYVGLGAAKPVSQSGEQCTQDREPAYQELLVTSMTWYGSTNPLCPSSVNAHLLPWLGRHPAI